MSDRSSYDALQRHIPREIRSKLLAFDRKDDEPQAKRPREEEEAEIPEFRYDKLPVDKKRIRLLRLLPGVLENPQIDCEMFEAEFDDDDKLVKIPGAIARGGGGARSVSQEQSIIKYEALSWRWGDEANGKYAVMIHKDGALYRKRVSETLGLALKYLRFERERLLWIDALCINQDDHDERSAQVAMMSLVYTAAEKACVWLGEDDDESTMAIKFIREEINQLKDFDSLCTQKQHAPKWRSLLVLMQRPWFSRKWVVQEIVLAKKATVYCGPDKIEWLELAIAVELFVEVETATHRLSELMKKDEKFTLIPNWFEHISELGASLLVNATARVYRGPEHKDGALITQCASRRSLLSLEYLVTSLSIFDCGRPHDSVYALIAIARDARPFAPSASIANTRDILVTEVCSHFVEEKPYALDYNSPYPDVCRDFTQFCIERCASIDRVQALDILCRPWAKDWLPGEVIPQDQKARENPGDSEKQQPRKREEPWLIQIMAGKLKDELGKHGINNGTDNEKIAKLLEIMGSEKANLENFNLKNPMADTPDEEFIEIPDNRNFEKYWAYAKQQSPVSSIIEQWFPKPEKGGEEATKMEKSSVEQPAGEKRKVSTKKTRNPARNGRPNAEEKNKEISCPKKTELGLPSWVARITAAPFDIFPHPGMDMVKMGRKNADPLVGIPQDGHRNYNAGQTKKIDLESSQRLKFRKRPRCHHYSLYVKGFWFDTVESVAQVSQGGAIPGEWLDVAGWPEARRPQRPGQALKDPPPEFWRTLVADRGMLDRNPPYYYARACKETILKGGLRSGAVDTTALIYNERNSIVAEFCRRVQAVIWNRALIKTEKGRLGLASDKVKAGDMVCILYGCTVPIILRKKKWKTEGERKLERFEDGVEAMKNLVRKCQKNRARRARWEEEKKTTDEDKKKERQVIIEETKKFNEKNKKDADSESDAESTYPSDYDTEDITDSESETEAGLDTKSSPGSSPKAGTEAKKRGNMQTEANKLEDTQMEVEKLEQKQTEVNNQEDRHTRTKLGKKQEKANKRDPYRHYEFFGEAYIHGMMDGEAVRENFYNLKPDHLFEIR